MEGLVCWIETEWAFQFCEKNDSFDVSESNSLNSKYENINRLMILWIDLFLSNPWVKLSMNRLIESNLNSLISEGFYLVFNWKSQ